MFSKNTSTKSVASACSNKAGSKQKKRMLISAVAALGVTLGAVSIAAVPAEAAVRLGGIDVQLYCMKNVPSGNFYVVSKALIVNPFYHGWRCGMVNSGLVRVDMDKACRQQYPAKPFQPVAYALRNGDGIYDWACFRY